MITSTQNTKLKLVRSLLSQARGRREAGAFVAEGVRLVEDALKAGWPVRFALVGGGLSPRGQALVHTMESKHIEFDLVDERLMNSISATEHSQGILAVLEQKSLMVPESPEFLLVADRVRDPGNLGTLLRTAEAAGVQAVLLAPDSADPFSPKVIRAGMGVHFRLPLLELSWDEISRYLKGLEIFLAEMETGVACWQADFRQPLALIIGGEADGASQEARTFATQKVFIPMMGKTESLNAGIAGAILLYEVLRQKRKGDPGRERDN